TVSSTSLLTQWSGGEEDRRKTSAASVYFEKELESQVIMEGKSALMSCEVSSANVPVTWKKDGTVVENGVHYIVRKKGPLHTLEIRKLQLADAGEYFYTCEVANKFGVTSYNGNITIVKTVQPVPAVQTPIHPPLTNSVQGTNVSEGQTKTPSVQLDEFCLTDQIKYVNNVH
uniref:Ig-like domain-containing protein n=1 Tax=Xiphophorus couchianus TaxID=32473 RepID=A0A3B5KZD8_9TELE